MSVHEKFKPFPCTLCEKSFPRAENLRLHTRLVHEKVRLFPCSECDMYFSTKSHAQRHFKKVHESKYFEKVGEEYAEEVEEENGIFENEIKQEIESVEGTEGNK